jgi:maltose/maltodextrin transport system substrate-binding protein
MDRLLVNSFPSYEYKVSLSYLRTFSAAQAFVWTDGELLIWISSNRPFHALSDIGKTFEEEVGAPVKVETQEKIIDNFQAAAQSGKGPDIFFWANDRIGEWADSGLLKPLDIKEEFKAKYLPMSWDAVTHKQRVWGYPVAL